MSVDEVAFGSLTIRYDDRLLRPRPWTAGQSTWAAELMRTAPEGPVLELCAGAGHIGLLAIALEPRSLVCVDINPAAAQRIGENAAAAGLSDLVETRVADLASALEVEESFAVVIADPPWVPRDDVGRFPEDPPIAIDGGDDGLDLARACVAVAGRHLTTGGSVLLQLGTSAQASALAPEVAAAGLEQVEVRQFERGVVVRLVPRSGA